MKKIYNTGKGKKGNFDFLILSKLYGNVCHKIHAHAKYYKCINKYN